MLLHEKMRLQRKVNKLTLRQLKASNRKERITKNISRVQKMYSSKMSQLESQAKNAQSLFTNYIQQSSGLSMGLNPWNFQGGGGVSQFVINQMAGILGSGKLTVGQNNEAVKIEGTQFQEMMQDYYGGFQPVYQDPNNTSSEITAYKARVSGREYSKEEYSAFQIAMQQAQQYQSMAQAQCQQMSAQYQSNVSIWLEAAKEQLEREQEAALAPLEAEETEMDLERESCEAQLADAKARLESIKQACSEGIKDSAPTFGLG